MDANQIHEPELAPPPGHSISILIVDDNEELRIGLSAFLFTLEGLRCVGEARNGAEAIQLCGQLKPDIVLMDLVMPVMDGVAATREIRTRFPQVQVIILTAVGDDNRLIDEALQAGAARCTFKDCIGEELEDAVKQTYRDNREGSSPPAGSISA